jgi:AAA domain-containing protein
MTTTATPQTSRLSQAAPAVRPALKGRLLLGGPPGSGKTRSALIMASTLGDKVLVIDTEKESALTYADDFAFEHLAWHPPFDARELGKTLLEAGSSYDVIVVDSVSHFWQKEGGVLDVSRGKFTGWAEARKAQEAMVEGILGSTAHVLLCARARVEYTQERDGAGKEVVRKVGMAVKQDDDLEYELNVALDLAMDHTATVTKSRTTALPVGQAWAAHRFGELAERYAEWLKGGEPPADAKAVSELVARLSALPSEARIASKNDWLAKLGRPETLRGSQLEAARALVDEWAGPVPVSAPVAAQGEAEGTQDEDPERPFE